jgi:glycosyltransferase involved in cell wall biosynthesis
MISKKLTVLHVNKFHHVIGGAERVYLATAELLRQNGHTSIFFSMQHPDNQPCETEKYFMPFIDVNNCGIIDFLNAVGRNIYSFKARKLVSGILDKYRIDIVHLHNIHRQMSPSILHEFNKRGIPAVMTLHEYKTICPSYIMMANSKPCEECAQGKYSRAIKLKCVKGSFLRSALVTVEMYFHHKVLDIYKNIDIFIAPSMFMKDKHDEMGFKKRIVHLPYPLDINDFDKSLPRFEKNERWNKDTFIYFGRLETEKGLLTLIEAVRILPRTRSVENMKLKIIGEGSIKPELEEIIKKEGLNQVTFSGFLKGKELYREVMRCMAVVLPSEWYENYPVSVMETLAIGKPVIGARIGGIPEMVKDNETGLTFEPGNPADLSEKILYMMDNPAVAAEMGRKARVFAEKEFDIGNHYARLMEIYETVLSRRH